MLRKMFFCMIFIALAGPAIAAEPQMRAHYINVGQGSCCLMEFPCGAVLIDTGGQDEQHAQYLGNYLKAFFERRTDLLNSLNALVITHPHVDHTLGIKTVLTACRVKAYIDNGIVHGSGASGVKFVRAESENLGIVIREIQEEDITSLGAKVGLTDDVIDSLRDENCDPQIRILSGSLSTNPGWHPTPLTLFVNLKEVLMRQRFVVITSFITKVVRTDYYSPEWNRDVASRLGCCYQRDEGQMPEAGPEMAA
jgi:hypothetical protein